MSRTIAGLTLGEPLTLPQCVREPGGMDVVVRWEYAPDSAPCWNFRGASAIPMDAPPDAELDVFLNVPNHVAPEGRIRLIDGRVEMVTLFTRGDFSGKVRRLMQEKWGVPSSSPGIDKAAWASEAFTLQLSGADSGRGTIEMLSAVERARQAVVAAEYERTHVF